MKIASLQAGLMRTPISISTVPVCIQSTCSKYTAVSTLYILHKNCHSRSGLCMIMWCACGAVTKPNNMCLSMQPVTVIYWFFIEWLVTCWLSGGKVRSKLDRSLAGWRGGIINYIFLLNRWTHWVVSSGTSSNPLTYFRIKINYDTWFWLKMMEAQLPVFVGPWMHSL